MTEVIALKNHRYGSKEHKTGDRYKIPSAYDLRLYKALKRVEVAPPIPVAVPKYQTRAIVPVAEESVEVKPKRKYTRRDLVAE